MSKLHPERFADRLEMVGAGGSDLIPPAEIDNGKIALAICNLLAAAKRDELRSVVIDAEPIVEPAALPEPLPAPPMAAHAAILSGDPASGRVVPLRPKRPKLPDSYFRNRR